MTHSVSEKIIKNTVFNTIGRFWGILVALFLTPYILNHVGIERYGIWAVIGVLTGYFGLLDFGMGTSFVKYISEYYAKKDHKSINQVVSTGVVFYSIFGALIIAVAFLAMTPLLVLFRIPRELYGEAVFVFRLGVILFAASSIFSAFQALQGGLQRMDVSNKIAIGVSVPMVLGTVWFLENGYGLRGLMLNNAIIIAVTGAVNVMAGFRLLPELKFSPVLLTREMFGKLFAFGYKMQSAKIADAVVFQADRLLLCHFLGVGAAGVYQLGSSIAYHLRGVSLLLISAVLPAASDLDAKQEHDKLKTLYLKGSKYLVLVSFPLAFFTMASAGLIIRTWVGPGYERAAVVLQLLAAGYLANLLSGVGTSVGAAIGKPEFQMRAAIITAVSNIVLSVALILWIGFFGVAVATVVSFVLGTVYFFFKLHSRIGLSSKKVILETVPVPLCAALLPALGICGLHYRLKAAIMGAGRLGGLELLVLEGLAFLGIYLAVILRGGYLDGFDRDIMRKAVSYLTSRRTPSEGRGA